MNITITKATEKDIPEIVALKQSIWNQMEHKEWYIIYRTTEVFLKNLLKNEGLILKAINQANEIIGFLIVERFLEEEGDLRKNLSVQNIEDYIEMTNAAVSSDYRGLELQRKMILKAEEIMLAANNNIKFSVATIHPDNKASLHTFTSIGYEIIAEKEMYHCKRRCIVMKQFN